MKCRPLCYNFAALRNDKNNLQFSFIRPRPLGGVRHGRDATTDLLSQEATYSTATIERGSRAGRERHPVLRADVH